MYQFTTIEAIPVIANTVLGGWDMLRLRLDKVAKRKLAQSSLGNRRFDAFKQRVSKLDAWIATDAPFGPGVTSVKEWVLSLHTRFRMDPDLPCITTRNMETCVRVYRHMGLFAEFLSYEAPINIETKVSIEDAKSGMLDFVARTVARSDRRRNMEQTLKELRDDYNRKIRCVAVDFAQVAIQKALHTVAVEERQAERKRVRDEAAKAAAAAAKKANVKAVA